jgi:hypothetical protein
MPVTFSIRELREDGPLHHLPHLRGDTRDRVHPAAVGLHHQARRRAPVGKDVARPLRHVGLDEVRLRHLPSQPQELLAEEVLDLLPSLQAESQRRGQPLAGDVVAGGSQAARGDHHVGPGERQAEGLGDALLVVPNGPVMEHVHADLGQPLGDPLGVRVGDLAEQDLGADADDLRVHEAGSRGGRSARHR